MQRVGLIVHLLNTLLNAMRQFDCSLIEHFAWCNASVWFFTYWTLCLMQCVGLIVHLLNTLLDATRRFDFSTYWTLCLMQRVGLIVHLLNTLLDATRQFDCSLIEHFAWCNASVRRWAGRRPTWPPSSRLSLTSSSTSSWSALRWGGHAIPELSKPQSQWSQNLSAGQAW